MLALTTNRLAFGGDYNPEQWPRSVWQEDLRLMGEAGVTMVTVGVFSWALLEPEAGRYTFDWLDEVIDGLASAGIDVDLATASASPPPWFSAAHPDSLPVDVDGRRLWPGSRQAYCPSSPDYRRAAVGLATQLAERYGRHPALRMWHVNNEYGCHVPRCYCDTSAAAFRTWLRGRYQDDLDNLNTAWGTAFWSQRYTAWDQVGAPRATPAFGNPTQSLDFWRFSSDELLECFRAERDVLHRLSPGVPVTTNFMVGSQWELDYQTWATEVDVITNDHYLDPAEDPRSHLNLAFSADLTRSLRLDRPWLLMEHSTSAVNWQPRNVAKSAAQRRRNTVSHIARGSDGALFFQWRASVAGAEKFHSAMLPHAGTESRHWRSVVDLGADVAALAEVAGSTVRDARAALLIDWASVWASRLGGSQPSVDMVELDAIQQWHAAFGRRGVGVDLRRPSADLSSYALVVAPALYLVDDAALAGLRSYVAGGGTLVLGAFSGIVDEHDTVRWGGYPGGLRDVIGATVEEFCPLPAGQVLSLDDGGSGTIWSEDVRVDGAEVLVRYAHPGPEGHPQAGTPALTRHRFGDGWAYYLSTRPEPDTIDRWLATCCDTAGVAPTLPTAPGLEAARRGHADGRTYLFLVNHGDDVTVPATGTDLLTGGSVDGSIVVPAGSVAVIRESAPAVRSPA